MNLRQQISKFRSEILIGNYDSALSLGKSIITNLQLLEQMGIIKSEHMKHIIQEEYDKCLILNNHINYKRVLKEEDNVKKWSSSNKSPEKGKWKKKEVSTKRQLKRQEQLAAKTPPKASKFSKHPEEHSPLEDD